VDRRFLHVLALVLPALIETLSLYVHTLRTVYRIKARTMGKEKARYGGKVTRLFVMEQVRQREDRGAGWREATAMHRLIYD